MDKRYNPNNTDTHKQCADCKRVLTRTMFHVARAKHDGLMNYCKDCMAERNRKRYAKIKDRSKRRRDELKAEMLRILGGSCSRCGYSEFNSGLDFHHVSGDKDDNVAKMLTAACHGNGDAHAALVAEVNKCIVLCRNCHMALHSGDWSID